MSEIDGKGISQLLLSPLFLLNHILGTVVPGALLILLLALKGNVLLRNGWLNPLFGYKTKVAIFLMLAFVIGSMLRLPLQLLAVALKPLLPKTAAPVFASGHNPMVQKMIGAIMTDGVLLARPALSDRLSLFQTDAAFHVGIGTALLVAAFVPGDGSLRTLEAVLGTAMFLIGFRKGVSLSNHTVNIVAVGLADIIGGMTPQQLSIAKAVVISLGLDTASVEVSPTIAAKPEPPGSQKQASVTNT
jgi:hypothetical protein